MTAFDMLNQKYAAQRRAYFEDLEACWFFLHRFADAFRDHIGAPEGYEQASGLDAELIPYVTVQNIHESEDGTFETSDLRAPNQLQRDERGYWSVAISVSLELAPRTWPKVPIRVPIRLKIEKGEAHLFIARGAEGAFTGDLEQMETFRPAFDHLVEIITRSLELDPYERLSAREKIGFDPPAPEKKLRLKWA